MRQNVLIFFLTVLFISSCIGAGTHGSIKGYEYPVSKYRLEEAVDKVLQESLTVFRDTVRNYMVDVTDGRSDTIYNDYYNDGTNYVTIKIAQEGGYNKYTFRYLGDSTYWASSETSEIFIAYAFDKDSRGGSEGNGGVAWYKPFLKKRLTSIFEREFIEAINKELGVKPTVTE